MARAPDNRIIIEFHHVGSYVKVSAVDPVSYDEVSIVGDPARGEHALKLAALRKLRYVQEKKAKEGPRR